MKNESTELEIIMREALLENDIFFEEQVYTKTEFGSYTFDFVVYGTYCKIVVECDGPFHYNMERWFLDARRDLWSIQNGLQDVIRFSGYHIRKDIQSCINEINIRIRKYDEALSHDEAQKEKINTEREGIKQKKNSPFYKFDRPYSQYSGTHATIWDDESLQRKAEQEERLDKMERTIRNPKYEMYPQSMVHMELLKNSKHDVSPTHAPLNPPTQSQPIDIGDRIPVIEKATWKILKSLPKDQKHLLWKLIKETNKDGIAIYKGSNKEIQFLLDKCLIVKNTLYKGGGEISLYVLPYAPNLLRNLIKS